MADAKERPYRVVDRSGQGWYLAATGDGGTKYQASYGFQRDIPDMPDYETLAAYGAPLRPVLPVTDADQAAIEAQLRESGRKVVTTLAAALAETYDGLLGLHNGPARHSWAEKLIKAGREGSWESECLMPVVWLGKGLKPSRVHPEARDALAEVFTGWVTGPDRYTEVAENLASIISGYADRQHGPDGWRRIADQWLQPGALAANDFRATYRWLYSRSEHFEPGHV